MLLIESQSRDGFGMRRIFLRNEVEIGTSGDVPQFQRASATNGNEEISLIIIGGGHLTPPRRRRDAQVRHPVFVRVVLRSEQFGPRHVPLLDVTVARAGEEMRGFGRFPRISSIPGRFRVGHG